MPQSLAALRRHEIVGPVTISEGQGGLPRITVRTPRGAAEIYLQGAHVTQFQKTDEPPMLFTSRNSHFAPGQAIRGGVPICYPWFGARAGGPSHGVARLIEWTLVETSATAEGSVAVRLALPDDESLTEWSSLHTEFIVTVADTLTMELKTTRKASQGELRFENCLHTYFHVGDIESVALTGLTDAPFDDFAFGAGGARRIEHAAELRISQETNRVYPGNSSAVEIVDSSLGRVIRVDKSGAQSTVVWNPWTTQKMPDDFDQVEYRRMVCVESGNVKQDAVMLNAGQSTSLQVVVSSHPLK